MGEVEALVERLAAEVEGASAGRVVQRALETFGADVAISFSGAEDVLLIEYAKQAGLPFCVFSLDTGRLHPETYRFFDRVEKHYQIHIEYVFPQAALVEKLVRAKGQFSFYEDGHQECCAIRKVDPLKRVLFELRAWITGQRRDQSPGTRAEVAQVERDGVLRGRGGHPLVKLNPLARMTAEEVWNAIRAFEVPHNDLHAQGYRSIGCEPCTRAVLPGQHEREGRWWWEQNERKECGLHRAPDGEAGEPSQSDAEGSTDGQRTGD